MDQQTFLAKQTDFFSTIAVDKFVDNLWTRGVSRLFVTLFTQLIVF
jgi:hypothetical protein